MRTANYEATEKRDIIRNICENLNLLKHAKPRHIQESHQTVAFDLRRKNALRRFRLAAGFPGDEGTTEVDADRFSEGASASTNCTADGKSRSGIFDN